MAWITEDEFAKDTRMERKVRGRRKVWSMYHLEKPVRRVFEEGFLC